MQEPEYYQKLLIPVNIVVVLLCLTAVFSLLFAPLLSLDLGQTQSVVLELMNSVSPEGAPEEGGEGNIAQTAYPQSAASETADEGTEGGEGETVQTDIPGVVISLSIVQIAEFAYARDASAVLINVVIDAISSSIERIAVGVTVNEILSRLGDGPEIDKGKIDNTALYAKLVALGSAENKDAAISAFSEELRSQLGADVITDARRSQIDSYLEDLYNDTMARTDKFGIEALVCVAICEMQDTDPANYSTTYRELFGNLLGDPQDEATAPLRSNIQNIAKIVSYFVDVMLFFVGVWAVLAVFAFVHIFTEEKRCAMWYVKLFGFVPCLVFGILPLAAGGLLAGIGGIGALLASVRSLTWISGGCYVALWLVSVFWAHPIKKKLDEAEFF